MSIVENVLDNTLFSKSFILFLLWLENENFASELNLVYH